MKEENFYFGCCQKKRMFALYKHHCPLVINSSVDTNEEREKKKYYQYMSN